MRLKYLWIEDFKNLKNFEIDFEKGNGLTMLIGTNGSGKSNILECISAIFSDAYSNLCTMNCKYLLIYEKEGQVVYIANTSNTAPDTSTYTQILALPCNRTPDGKSSKIKRHLDAGAYTETLKRGDLVERIAKEDKLCDLPAPSDGYESFMIQRPTRTDVYLPSKVIAIYSGEDDRLYDTYFRQPYMDFSRKLIKQDRFVKLRLQYINKHFWWIAMLVLALGDLDNTPFFEDELHISKILTVRFFFDQREVARNRYQPLKNLISHINPDNYEEVEVTFDALKDYFSEQNYGMHIFNIFNQGAMSETLRTIKHVDITFATGFGLLALSEGEKKQLLFKLLYDYLAEEDSLILLDEPDAHIHETKKKELYHTLLEMKDTVSRQILLTSHSPTLVDIANDCHICFLEKNADGLASITQQEKMSLIEFLTGNRMDVFTNRPVIYCEGGENSSDKRLLTILFPKKNIIACGDCDNVINKTKHHNDAFPGMATGIIDADYHTNERKAALAEKSVFTLDVLEIENVLMDFAIVEAFKEMCFASDENVENFKHHFFSIMENDKDIQAARHTSNTFINEINMRLHAENRNVDAFKASVAEITDIVKIDAIYAEKMAQMQNDLQNEAYDELIKRFDFNHNIDRFFSRHLAPDYACRVLRLIGSQADLQEILRQKYYHFIK